ncbi:proline-rich protein 23E [Hippopotamus amphibius kiboko]|uniref:proline-rich protein 23E n=1 Tax=Hippopotamus amphibius kiboko TaxID=575201 RepID=UPI002598F2CF|nr:proline-rich protein 23E [Hippopotamus amphibius kiboko]
MGARASEEQAVRDVCRAPQAPAAAPGTWAAPAPWAVMGPACACCPPLGAQPLADPACWPDVGAPVLSPPGFAPPMGSQHSAPLAPGVSPYPVGPPPPYSSVPTALSGDASGPRAQVGWQTPASSAPRAAVGGPSRGVSHLKTCQVLPSERLSTFSIWAPKAPCSPELCPLPPSPSADPQPEPHCPRSPRPLSRARRRLF